MTPNFNMDVIAAKLVRLGRIERAARALFEHEYPQLLDNADTGAGQRETDFEAEFEESAPLWFELRDALAE